MRTFLITALLLLGCNRPSATFKGETEFLPPQTNTPRPRPKPDLDVERAQPVRVSGDVMPPVVLHRVAPVFPKIEGSHRIGIMIVEAVVTKDGIVRDIRVLKGPGNEHERAIVYAVKQWRYKPATLHGEAVDVLFNVTVNHVPYDISR